MKNLYVNAFLKELGSDNGGQSKPVMIIADDSKTYILKNQNVYDQKSQSWTIQDCMFLQELLVSKIAEYLEVPIPETAIVNVQKEHIDHATALQFVHRYSPGKHFSSEYLSEVENNLKLGYQQLMIMEKPYTKTSWKKFFNQITNPKDVAKIIAMDFLIANFDRFGNEGNLIVSNENGNRKIFAIDHGHAFYGACWIPQKIQFLSNVENSMAYIIGYIKKFVALNPQTLSGLGLVFRAIEEHIDISNPSSHDFLEVVNKIEQIDQDLLDEWFSDIPDEWFVDKTTQIAYYKKFILINKNNLRNLIDILVANGAFTNTNGGKLLWRDIQTGIQ